MPDDPNTTQNPISEKNSIPASPQEPTADAPIPATDSAPAEMLPEALESPINADNAVPVNNDNPENSPILTPSPEEASPTESVETPVIPASNEANKSSIEPVSEPIQTNEPSTAQMPVNELLLKISLPRELLVKARNMIQLRKRKKLDKIMSLFLQKSKIINDEVEKLLHVSDATATRYLSQLEKEGKIQQSGKVGKGVSYSKI